jgi:hypothetical protein
MRSERQIARSRNPSVTFAEVYPVQRSGFGHRPDAAPFDETTNLARKTQIQMRWRSLRRTMNLRAQNDCVRASRRLEQKQSIDLQRAKICTDFEKSLLRNRWIPG